MIISFLSSEGLPPLTGTLTVHVIVGDINDNCPEFTEYTYITIVSEESPAGTVCAMITASDIDEGANGKIRYSCSSKKSLKILVHLIEVFIFIHLFIFV